MARTLEYKPCRLCGKPVQRKRRTDKGGYYYSPQCPECFGKYRNKELHRKRIAAFMRSKKNPNRKPIGSTFLHASTPKLIYRQVKVGERKWAFEHRAVMERALGRKLKRSEHVHHLNGDTLDNSIGNLKVLTRDEHMRLHTSLNGRWALKFDACVECSGTKFKHISHGLCSSCYQLRDRRLNPERFKKYAKRNYRRHKVAIRNYNRDYVVRNRERLLAYYKEYNANRR